MRPFEARSAFPVAAPEAIFVGARGGSNGCYGTLKAWASKLGHDDVARLLDETLQDEIKTDQLLTKVAEGLPATRDEAAGRPRKSA